MLALGGSRSCVRLLMRFLTDARVSNSEDLPAARIGAPAAPSRRSGKLPSRILNRCLIGRVVTYAVLSLGSFLYVIPFLGMLRTSFMGPLQLRDTPADLWPDPWTAQNYMAVWEAAPIANWIVNSLVLVALGLFGQTFVSILVAFGFARTQFPGRNQLFVVVLATLMLPHQMMTVPWYAMFRTVGLLNSLWAVALPDLWGNAFYIFIFRQFFLTLPVELDEAAEIDGANLWQVLFRVVIPLSKPAIATVTVFNIVAKWNQFFFPFVFVQSPEKLTLPAGIRWYRTQHGTEFHMLMVPCIISIVPIVIFFFIAQKYFVRGVVLAGIRP